MNKYELTFLLDSLFGTRHRRLDKIATQAALDGDYAPRSPKVLASINRARISNSECEYDLRAKFLNHESNN